MKKIFTALLFAAVSAFAVEDMDIFERNKAIGRGLNLGNALEAPNEGDWSVYLKEHYFSKIADAGFNSVRIPIKWSNHASKNAPYKIDETFMKRVEWAVAQALENDLVVIIDIHHFDDFVNNPQSFENQFYGLWRQISQRFKNHPDSVYFEVLNEPCNAISDTLWNEYLAEAISIIRETNPTRPLIVGPGFWNNADHFEKLKLPENDRNIIGTFHHYQPFEFTHQGADWVANSSGWEGKTWSPKNKADLDPVKWHFDCAEKWSKSENRPVYMGEFGAYEKAPFESRIKWTKYMRAESESRGIPWTYWEFCSTFGVYDPNTEQWKPEILKALIPETK